MVFAPAAPEIRRDPAPWVGWDRHPFHNGNPYLGSTTGVGIEVYLFEGDFEHF